MWPISAVVVDLPLVPVMATTRGRLCSGAAFTARAKSSISPITGTPAARAAATVQCGAGWVKGTPGATTSAAKSDQSAAFRVDELEALGARGRPRRRVLVPSRDLRAAGDQRPRRRETGPSEPEHGDGLAGGNRETGIIAASASRGRAWPA